MRKPKTFDDWNNRTDGGAFSTRLKKFYWEIFNHQLSPEALYQAGELSKRYSLTMGKYEFDFDNHFCWKPGEYGDRDSCFHTFNWEGFALLRWHKALGIRFFDNDKGFARAFYWQAPNKPFAILWNPYGPINSDIPCVVTDYLNSYFKQIQLSNSKSGQKMYSHAAWIIGKVMDIAPVEYYDLAWEMPPKDFLETYDKERIKLP